MSAAIQPPNNSDPLCDLAQTAIPAVRPDPLRNPDPLYDIQQAAQYAGTTVRFMRRLTHEERIQVVRIGGRVRFRKSALDGLIDTNTRAAARNGPPADKARIPPRKSRTPTGAAPIGRTVHAEPADRIAPPVPAKSGKGKGKRTGPVAG